MCHFYNNYFRRLNRIWCNSAVPDRWGNMASTGGVTMEGDLMRHAEYSVTDKMKSDADIDRRLVGFGFYPKDTRDVALLWKCSFNPDVRLLRVNTRCDSENVIDTRPSTIAIKHGKVWFSLLRCLFCYFYTNYCLQQSWTSRDYINQN